jgi:hypothetical protein
LQHKNNIKPIKTPIEEDADSFILGLFQFRCARKHFCFWESASVFYLSVSSHHFEQWQQSRQQYQ